MNRSVALIIGLVFALGVAAGYAWHASAGDGESLSIADVRSIVEEMLADAGGMGPQVATIDPDEVHPIIENYLMGNPRILERMSIALDAELQAEAREEARVALASLQDELYADPDHVVLGNPDGDVTLVEMFDYNCGYCRQSVADILELLDEDPGLRLILKEFPILSEGSREAALVGVTVAQQDVDYLEFHTALFAERGQIGLDSAMSVATDLGLSRAELQLRMLEPDVTAVIERSYNIARTLGISGTPTFILGDEIIRGAVGVDALRAKIANMRACGSTSCES